MKDSNFNAVREFLEDMVKEHPENQEFLTTYQQLIESKFEYDKAEIEKQ